MSKVAIMMGSKSDLSTMKGATDALKEFNVAFDIKVYSAHRTPELVHSYVSSFAKENIEVVICGAGMAAHLAGAVSAHATIPVIGVPLASGPLAGFDALLSTVQMPKGIPVATVAVNNSYNAGILAVQMLALKHSDLREKLVDYKKNMQQAVIKTNAELENDLKNL